MSHSTLLPIHHVISFFLLPSNDLLLQKALYTPHTPLATHPAHLPAPPAYFLVASGHVEEAYME